MPGIKLNKNKNIHIVLFSKYDEILIFEWTINKMKKIIKTAEEMAINDFVTKLSNKIKIRILKICFKFDWNITTSKLIIKKYSYSSKALVPLKTKSLGSGRK